VIFTRDLREAELFLPVRGSGGWCESGSDCWKAYMRHATGTIDYGKVPALAQGMRFDIR